MMFPFFQYIGSFMETTWGHNVIDKYLDEWKTSNFVFFYQLPLFSHVKFLAVSSTCSRKTTINERSIN